MRTDKGDDAAALVVSHWFDAGPVGGPAYAATIRLTGRRRGVTGRPASGDTFTNTTVVQNVVPGSGRVASSSWIYGITAGEWDVTAELVGPEGARAAARGRPLPRAAWSWRRWSLSSADGPVTTRWAPLAPFAAIPAVLPGSFTLLATVAIIAALATQPWFFRLEGIAVTSGLLASVIGVALGLAGAKAWYMVLKGPSRGTLKEGWSVDGFVLTAPVVAALVAVSQSVQLGGYLDAVVPGIFLAVAIGRIGCFLTGCCAGRPTTGRGIWSSDRRIGARRIPAQLLESATGVVLAAVASLAVIAGVAPGSGVVFALSMLVYLAARQGLLRLRAEARAFSWRRGAPGVAARGMP
ncbi:MAG TPA: prolipoprotein diacylglyceryl transferase family protein [Candidatus Limnocylindrales bacterium]